MGERLAHLHNAHDRNVDLIMPVLEHPFVSGLLFFRLLKININIFESNTTGQLCWLINELSLPSL